MNQVYISFFEAIELLKNILGATPSKEEFWMWCFEGKKLGGLDAYTQEEGQYSRVHAGGFGMGTRQDDCTEHNTYRLCDLTRQLKNWLFLQNDIEAFEPARRYITGQHLRERWSKKLKGEDEAAEYIQDFSQPLPLLSDSDSQQQQPHLDNYYPGAEFEWENGLGGIYLLDDVYAVENYCRMKDLAAALAGRAEENQEQSTEKVTRNQIKKIFPKLTSDQWRGNFSRENENGLGKANVGEPGKPIYILTDVCEWLMQKAYYSEAEIKAAIKKYSELPADTAKPSKSILQNNSWERLASKIKKS